MFTLLNIAHKTIPFIKQNANKLLIMTNLSFACYYKNASMNPVKQIFKDKPNQDLDIRSVVTNFASVYSIINIIPKQRVTNQTVSDERIQRSITSYFEFVSKYNQMNQSLADTFIKALDHQDTKKSLEIYGKNLTEDILKEESTEREVVSLIQRVFKDSEVKYHVKESFIDVFKKDDVEDELVKMLIAASTNKLFLSSLGDSIEISLLGLLKNKEFVEKLKFFAFYLMQNEQEENIKKHVKYIEKQVRIQ